MFKLALLLVCSLITISSCTKKSKTAFKGPEGVVNVTCGTIDMSPKNSLYPTTMVNFEPIFPNNVTISDLQWNFKKGTNTVYTTTDTLVSHVFNGTQEGAGSYTAVLTFQKSDGNACALEQTFQILASDICVPPSGISGPSIGYINEETSPFYVDYEECFSGRILWDMNNDGVYDYDKAPNERVTYTYNQAGIQTIKAAIIDNSQDEQIALTTTIEIKNKSCLHPFTNQPVLHGTAVEFAKPSLECGEKPCERAQRVCNNGTFGGDTSFTLNPESCALSVQCLACGTTPHNGVETRWKQPETCGVPCSSQSRTCNNGQMPAFDLGFDYTSEALCPTAECPPQYTYSWSIGDWSACSATACNTQGTQTRAVICKRNDGVTVDDSQCTESKPATSQACSARPCNTCTLPWGGTVAHGGTATAYKESNVEYGGTCESQIRTCTDGSLSGSYTHRSCAVAEPKNCTLDGATVLHGQSKMFYLTSSVACPATCNGASRTCENGVLSGSAQHTKATCTAGACTYAWKTSEFGACSATACGTQGVKTRTVVCQRGDGVTVADSFCSGTKPSTTEACSARECYACNVPWGGTIPHNTEITAYKESVVGCGSKCNSQQRKCNDGHLGGAFTMPTCSAQTCETDTCKIESVEQVCGVFVKDSKYSHHRIAPLNYRWFDMMGDAFAKGKTASFDPFKGGNLSTSAYKMNTKTGAITAMKDGMKVEKDEVLFCNNNYDDTSRQFVRYSQKYGYVLSDVPDSDYKGGSPLPNITCRYPPPKTVKLMTSAQMKCTENGAIPDPSKVDPKNRVLWENAIIGMHCAY